MCSVILTEEAEQKKEIRLRVEGCESAGFENGGRNPKLGDAMTTGS